MQFVESEFDKQALKEVRHNVDAMIAKAQLYEDLFEKKVLEIAPQIHKGAKARFKRACVLTLDIDENSEADYKNDLCSPNKFSPQDNDFDAIICTEVLEHTRNPFKAVDELYRMLKPGGYVYVTTPFNVRIHGPAPDCWRFTEDGLFELFKSFDYVYLSKVNTKDRDNMPICYSLIARK